LTGDKFGSYGHLIKTCPIDQVLFLTPQNKQSGPGNDQQYPKSPRQGYRHLAISQNAKAMINQRRNKFGRTR